MHMDEQTLFVKSQPLPVADACFQGLTTSNQSVLSGRLVMYALEIHASLWDTVDNKRRKPRNWCQKTRYYQRLLHQKHGDEEVVDVFDVAQDDCSPGVQPVAG